MIYTTAQTLAQGQRAGWFAVLGLHIGGYVHVVAGAFGLAVLLDVFPALYTVLKYAGAAYLLYLGVGMILQRAGVETQTEVAPATSPRHAFWQSVTVEVLNPKTILFYVAFLPQFIDISANFPLWAQFIILGAIVNVMFSSADVICVVLATRMMGYFKSANATHSTPRKIGGAILVGLAVYVLCAG